MASLSIRALVILTEALSAAFIAALGGDCPCGGGCREEDGNEGGGVHGADKNDVVKWMSVTGFHAGF